MSEAVDQEQLWGAIDRLWGWMPTAEVKAIRREEPALAELAVHAHHRTSHEQHAMRVLARGETDEA